MTMKLSTLKAAERAAWRLRAVFNKVRKTDAEAERLYKQVSDFWLERHTAKSAVECALAERKDKGRKLFTVVVPEKYGRMEYVRTPHRLIATRIWAGLGGEADRRAEPYVEVCTKWETPEYTRKNLMAKEGAIFTDHSLSAGTPAAVPTAAQTPAAELPAAAGQAV